MADALVEDQRNTAGQLWRSIFRKAADKPMVGDQIMSSLQGKRIVASWLVNFMPIVDLLTAVRPRRGTCTGIVGRPGPMKTIPIQP